MKDYNSFLIKRSHIDGYHGFGALEIPEYLFDFQKSLAEWALKKGRGAIFADCGLGKTIMQLVWADNVCRFTNGNVLILTPLAVSQQTEQEAKKFGIDAKKSDGKPHRITIVNYEKLHYFDSKDFVGCVCDESSILKNFDGKRKAQITRFMRKMKYRLLCTATAAPNDFIELGTSSEALGYMGHMDMLNKFFKNDQNNSSTKRMFGAQKNWRFKGHAEVPFWKWVSSWARAVRMPSDLGFDDGDFVLPGKEERLTVIPYSRPLNGKLFVLPAKGLREEREERRATIKERCEKVAALVDHDKPALVWCQLNDEGDLIKELIPDSLQVAGKHSDTIKEERLMGFANGDFRVLVTKPKIGAWGLNYQHCSHMTFFPSHSYEQYYQSIRRCWRFGQKNDVLVDIVSTKGEVDVLKNLQYKSRKADEMFEMLTRFMKDSAAIKTVRNFTNAENVPTWLKTN